MSKSIGRCISPIAGKATNAAVAGGAEEEAARRRRERILPATILRQQSLVAGNIFPLECKYFLGSSTKIVVAS